MDNNQLLERLKDYLPEKRIRHSKGVARAAVKLAKMLNYDEEKMYTAGILHDVAKYIKFSDVPGYCEKYNIYLDEFEKESTALSHSVVGAYIVKYEFGINDEDILNAIRYHTTGKPGMSIPEKIIYLADLIEEGRDYEGVDSLRKLAYSGKIDEAIYVSMDNTIKVVLVKKSLLHLRTVDARNYYLKIVKAKKKEENK